MCSSKPKIAPVAPAPAPPEPESETKPDIAAREKAKSYRNNARLRQRRNATILTGGEGVEEDANVKKKTLLGQ